MVKSTTPPRPIDELSEIATNYALQGQWELAVKANKEILAFCKDDIDSLNRLGFAYTGLGKLQDASATFKKVLRLDSYNAIATKNLDRLKNIKAKPKKASKKPASTTAHPERLFLEEPGRTATVALVAVAEPKILLSLSCADEIRLVPRSHQISVVDSTGMYLGKIPDDLAARLLRLISGGNQYSGCIKGVHSTGVQIFIRETKRSKKFEMVHSFPIEDKYSYIAFTSPDLVHAEQPETRSLEDQDTSQETTSSDQDDEN